MTEPDASLEGTRIKRLLPLIDADPGNLALLEDAAETALNEGYPKIAGELVDRYEARTPLPPKLANIAGLAAIGERRFDKAAERYARLIAAGERDNAILFNLAWCRAQQQDLAGALELLTTNVTAALPQAAMLHVQVLHELGEFETAGPIARAYVEQHADYGPLMAAVSVLALDIEDEELAARCASSAPDHPEAMTTLATLALGGDRPLEALPLFDEAISRNEHQPRAWIGRGLAGLLTGNVTDAAADLDRGAEMFGNHLGSWLAAGWAYFVNRDIATSRARFEHALELDDTFAETHGSLAVLDLVEGKEAEARRRLDVALRLDRKCYSAALAQTMMAASAGDSDKARKIFEIALTTPIDGSGRTIAQAMARMGVR